MISACTQGSLDEVKKLASKGCYLTINSKGKVCSFSLLSYFTLLSLAWSFTVDDRGSSWEDSGR